MFFTLSKVVLFSVNIRLRGTCLGLVSLMVISYLDCFLLMQYLGVEKVFALINPASLAAFQLPPSFPMQITQTLRSEEVIKHHERQRRRHLSTRAFLHDQTQICPALIHPLTYVILIRASLSNTWLASEGKEGSSSGGARSVLLHFCLMSEA